MAKYRFEQIAINSTEKKKPVEEDRFTYLGLEHLDSGSLKVTRFGSDVAPIGEKLVMRKGDVLFGKRRAYQKKVAIAPFDGIFSAHGMVLRPNVDVIDPNFFPLFISSDYFLDAAIKISVGSLSPTINWRDLKVLEFELPDLETQRKLAAVLWSINDTMESYKKLISATDELVKSQFMEQFGAIDSEGSFTRKQWKDVLKIVNGRDYKPIADPDGQYPVYGSGGLMGRATDYLCPEHTVVVGRKGTIDKPFVVNEKFWNVDTAFGVVPNQGVLHYLYLFWYCKQLDFKKLNKASTLPSTTKDDLLKLWINVPPYELQEQFAAFVRQSDKSKLLASNLVRLNIENTKRKDDRDV
ncbi:MAG: restriction endonuclease subunit S [Anaerobutyricum hallii]|uniref:restriction endonuclease subunit S n=1 Tax=Anaerobutyricum hallii TaxID=39488 RepID=UPI002E779829|nr:restriction endonuclease subunit S [Anaerobutyricum hallii]MEE1484768.1 restriction endonuclease subunit S [Anaerobutyricum hallii]